MACIIDSWVPTASTTPWVGPQASRELLDGGHSRVAAFGDDVRGAELPRKRCAVLVAGHGDDPLGAELLCGQNGHEPDGAVAHDRDRFARARTGGDGAEPSGSKNVGCGQERGEGRLVLGPSSRNDDERSVGQRDSRVLSLGSLDEAAVDATRLVAGAAYLTRVVGEAEGADDEVADLHVFHGVPDFGDRSHVFVAHRPSARRLEAAVRPQIRSADAGGGDFDDGVGRFDDGGDVEVFDPDVARAVHDCSSHGVSFRS